MTDWNSGETSDWSDFQLVDVSLYDITKNENEYKKRCEQRRQLTFSRKIKENELLQKEKLRVEKKNIIDKIQNATSQDELDMLFIELQNLNFFEDNTVSKNNSKKSNFNAYTVLSEYEFGLKIGFDECSICFSDVKNDAKMVELNCCKQFICYDCAKHWFETKSKCMFCNLYV